MRKNLNLATAEHNNSVKKADEQNGDPNNNHLLPCHVSPANMHPEDVSNCSPKNNANDTHIKLEIE